MGGGIGGVMIYCFRFGGIYQLDDRRQGGGRDYLREEGEVRVGNMEAVWPHGTASFNLGAFHRAGFLQTGCKICDCV